MPSRLSDRTDERQPLLRYQDPVPENDVSSYTTTSQGVEAQRETFTKNLGAIEAFGIIIGIVIGSGIFTSPGAIDTNVPSPGLALVVWLVGGVLAWTGATTFAELGTAIPGEGGIQPWLQHIYGDAVGFLAAWTWIVANQPCGMAILSMVFVESAYSAAGVVGQADRIEHKLFAILVLVALSVANSISTKASTRLNSFFVVVKFTGVLIIVVAGLSVFSMHFTQPDRHVGGGDWVTKSWFQSRTSTNPDGSETHWDHLSSWDVLGHLASALYAALWAYSGWDKVRLSRLPVQTTDVASSRLSR